MESRTVLGVPDAYELPRSPGHGYLTAGAERPVRFKAAYVSALAAQPRSWDDALQPVRGETVLGVLVRRLEGHGPPAHQVWLPPLDVPPTLDELLPLLLTVPGRGLTVRDATLHGALRGVAGIVDKPFEQRRDPMWIDLAGGGGNVIIVGSPQSGKTTVLRTLVGSLALTHTPREVQFYCLDFGGGAFSALTNLPHVGGVATRRDADRVRRTIAELHGLIQSREALFAKHGVEGAAAYRRARRDGAFAEDPFGDVFLVVDGWATLRTEFEDLEPLLSEIANRGLGHGVHILASATRWMDVRAGVRDMFGTKIELRLGEPSDSLINRRAATNVPEQSPGRGLTPDGFHFLAGLPRADADPRIDTLADGVSEFVRLVQNGWREPGAPAVRLLPTQLPHEALPEAVPGRLPIGIAESDLQPVYLDVDAEPHLLLFGDIECGKSTFLRGLATTITRTYTPEQARIILVDLRRSLLGCVQTEHLIGSGTSPQVTADLVQQVTTVMRERLPGADVTAQQLRDRSWWKGPELFLLVDDYDLVAGGSVNPLAGLLEYLPQARDIGLHVIITRRIGGASRAMFDPVIGRIRELASPGIMMSGPREEGPLFGSVKPQLLPPGRGWLFTRREGARLIQLPWLPPR
jgi:S-DNA-T family DNA segregation ATPase FtsK/SpoIIIE